MLYTEQLGGISKSSPTPCEDVAMENNVASRELLRSTYLRHVTNEKRVAVWLHYGP